MFVASLVGGGAPQWSQHFYNVQLSTVVHYKLYGSKKEIQEFRWHFDTIICQLKPKKESQIHNYQKKTLNCLCPKTITVALIETNTDKFQTAFAPPPLNPHFRKIMLQFFPNGYG